ncbi:MULTISPECIES: chemotaxis protein CheW [Legionella]|uniref:Chemotaxis protein CheW n=1 Tax=Legionella resiliens TaxID=2905958 RepID=A0ABS8X0D8_9GAMM|nr:MULTISPECIES: chemotaxis protein CheW [unclassified Legionella]MCE0721938.1 chemotaxis protein CheW [Legionella sp. 9fVS26]MCE3531092.1 chemotaxis protein CheW [Legionella sp. 8cVS16]QLZ70679.1 chemotaxis protein CheW [Legionella sp. PC1000]
MMIQEQKHASELMPKSKEALKILHARAKQLAQQELDIRKNHGIAFVRFNLSKNEIYGISYQYVQEILHNTSMAFPPFAPNFIAGVINWRGALITVVDLLKFFHLNHSNYNSKKDNQFIIVVQANNITLGLLVHRIEGSETYVPSELATPLSSANVTNPEYILGLHHAVTAIINMETFISSISQEIKTRLYKIGEGHGN